MLASINWYEYIGELLVKVVVDVVECWWCWFCCCLHSGKRYASKAIEVFMLMMILMLMPMLLLLLLMVLVFLLKKFNNTNGRILMLLLFLLIKTKTWQMKCVWWLKTNTPSFFKKIAKKRPFDYIHIRQSQ